MKKYFSIKTRGISNKGGTLSTLVGALIDQSSSIHAQMIAHGFPLTNIYDMSTKYSIPNK